MSIEVIKVKSFLDRKISRNGKMSATQTIELVRRLEPKLGEETATKLLDYIANQNGDLATRQDVVDVKIDLENKIEHVENKIELVKIDLENKIEKVESRVENVENKVQTGRIESRWLFGLCFGTVLTVMLYLHSNTGRRIDRIETDMKDLKTDMQELIIDMRELKDLIIESK